MHKNDTSTPLWTNLDDIETVPPKNIKDISNPRIVVAHIYSPIRGKNKALQHQNLTIISFFKHIIQDDARVNAVVSNIMTNLEEAEIKAFSKYLKTLKLKKSARKYDAVTPEIITKMEHFVGLIKKRDLTVFDHLKDTNVDLFQELRLAFNTGKILKNRLAVYFNALHSLNISPTMMMRHLRVIDPILFADKNLKNKKKAAAVYLLNSTV